MHTCRLLDGISDFHAEACRSVRDGDTIWSEWRWSGTRNDGQPFEVRGVSLFDTSDDQIVAGRLYIEEVERRSNSAAASAHTTTTGTAG
jgi:ketosteroid isomerase-like protein